MCSCNRSGISRCPNFSVYREAEEEREEEETRKEKENLHGDRIVVVSIDIPLQEPIKSGERLQRRWESGC